MFNVKSGYGGASLPWFMLDLGNYTLITSRAVPVEVTDTKQVYLAEIQMPGASFAPVTTGGFGNRHIAFSLQIMNRNNTIGNTFITKQFENLRNPVVGLTSLLKPKDRFQEGPKVLYSYGTGSIPLVYFVAKADFRHSLPNELGYPQYTVADIELILDEENPINKAEEVARKIKSVSGQVINAVNIARSYVKKEGLY